MVLRFCVILTVITITVQPINGAANVTATMQQPNDGSNITIFSDTGVSKLMAQSKSTKQVSSSNNSSRSDKTSISANASEPVKHRGIFPTNLENSSNSTKNTPKSSDKASAEITVNKKQSQIAPKVEQKVDAVILTVDNTTKATSSTAATKPTSTTSSSTSPTPTTTTTTTPKTTKTVIPKKPTVTCSIEDDPGALESVQAKKPAQPEKEVPVALQSSETISYQEQKSSHNFLMSIIALIVVVPFVVLVTNCAVRQVRDYWSKRRYRRMDYLIEDMYN